MLSSLLIHLVGINLAHFTCQGSRVQRVKQQFLWTEGVVRQWFFRGKEACLQFISGVGTFPLKDALGEGGCETVVWVPGSTGTKVSLVAHSMSARGSYRSDFVNQS